MFRAADAAPRDGVVIYTEWRDHIAAHHGKSLSEAEILAKAILGVVADDPALGVTRDEVVALADDLDRESKEPAT